MTLNQGEGAMDLGFNYETCICCFIFGFEEYVDVSALKIKIC